MVVVYSTDSTGEVFSCHQGRSQENLLTAYNIVKFAISKWNVVSYCHSWLQIIGNIKLSVRLLGSDFPQALDSVLPL